MLWCERCAEAVDPLVARDYMPHWELGEQNHWESLDVCRCPNCLSFLVDEPGSCDITGEPCDPNKNLSVEMYDLFSDYLAPALTQIGEVLEKMGYSFTRFKLAEFAGEWMEDYVN